MLWFSTCPSLFPIGVYDTDKHYTTNQSWVQNYYEIALEFSKAKGKKISKANYVPFSVSSKNEQNNSALEAREELRKNFVFVFWRNENKLCEHCYSTFSESRSIVKL